MNKILTFIALSVLLFKGNSPFTNPTYSKQQDKAINVSNCVEILEETADISFDFNDRTISSTQLFEFTATTSYNSQPIMKTPGNIILVKKYTYGNLATSH